MEFVIQDESDWEVASSSSILADHKQNRTTKYDSSYRGDVKTQVG